MSDWYYLRWGKIEGPLSDENWQDLRRRGELAPHTLVWTDGLENWIRADHPEVEQLTARADSGESPSGPPPPLPLAPPPEAVPAPPEVVLPSIPLPWDRIWRGLVLLALGIILLATLYASALFLHQILPREGQARNGSTVTQPQRLEPPPAEDTGFNQRLAALLLEMRDWNHWQPVQARDRLEKLEAHLVIVYRRAETEREQAHWQRLAEQCLLLRQHLHTFEDLRRQMEAGVGEGETLELIVSLDELERAMNTLKNSLARSTR